MHCKGILLYTVKTKYTTDLQIYQYNDCSHLLYIDVALLFFVVLLPESPKLMLNDSSHCNRTYTVSLVCRIHGGAKKFGFNPWKHVFNDVVIRSLDGFVDNRLGYLHINYCGYQDAGTYICSIWNSFSDGIYLTNTTAKLFVTDNLNKNLENGQKKKDKHRSTKYYA